MIKNQLYPYIESYLNEYLHGFTKEQLDIGVMKGEIKFENLNLRPDGINQKMDEKNIPFWLKAGLISKIGIKCSLMNFIGEKPLDVLIEDVDIILNPSYKWIMKNIDSFIVENKHMIKSVYDPNDNNSMDIFTKKINVLDNSIFKKEYIEEIFKDKTKISAELNKLFKFCFKFYYQKNFLINLVIKNIHIRFEDDQLINYTGDLALGIKIDFLELILSSEGVMKRDSIKVNKLSIYWEDPAVILIPSSLLNISIKDGKLDESYYTKVKKIKFQDFKYNKNTKFILQNFCFNARFGTKAINKAKIDFFNQTNNNVYKFYSQLHTNELNFNFFPELKKINQNFNKFVSEFTVLEQVQEFKPMKKPYNTKSPLFIEFMEFINKNKNPKYGNNFNKKKKMLVRDWLFYFYWCQKCKYSLIGKKINPLRLEFSRFYNLCFNFQNDFMNNNSLNVLENNENKIKQINKAEIPNIPNDPDKKGIEDYNPDKINLSYICDINIKGLNINLHPCNKNPNLDFICIKINNIDTKISLSKSKFDFVFCCNSIIIAPNELSFGEKVYLSSFRKKREQQNLNVNMPNININNNFFLYEDNYNQIINNIEENTGLTGLINKYNPNYKLKLRIIDEALEKIGNNNDSKKKNIFGESEISMTNYNSNFNNNNNKKESNMNINNINDNASVFNNNDINNSNNLNDSKYETNNNNILINLNNTHKGMKKHYFMKRNTSFAKSILSNYEGTPQLQKIELKRQKNNYSISQAIMDYNLKKGRIRISERNNNSNYNSTTNIFNTSNYSTYNSNTKVKSNINNDTSSVNSNIGNSNTKLQRVKPPIPSYSPKTKNKTSRTQMITTGENVKFNLFEILSTNNSINSNKEKALWFKMEKFNNENSVDTLDLKLGTLRFNLYSKYITTLLNIFSDYKDILKQPIIKHMKKAENSILVNKELLKMKKYIYNYILNLPEEKKNIQIKEYINFLKKEIEHGIKMGIESDIYEINYLFNFFPKGIEISFDYDALELIYYNSKKNNKISGKALIPSPELYFKLDFDKIDLKLFEFEIELEDLEDIKYILLKIRKTIQDKIKICKLFIEPCIKDIRFNMEQKARDSAKIKAKKKNKFDLIENLKNMKNFKNKNNNITNLNVKTNTNLNSNINKETKEDKKEDNTNDNNNKNNIINLKTKNLTYTNNDVKEISMNKTDIINIKTDKDNEENENINPSLSIDRDEKEVRKIKINKSKNHLNDSNDESSYLVKKENKIFNDEDLDLDISNDIKKDEKKN